MSKRSRDRHLAKLSARRQAERDAQRRRRQRTLRIVGGVAGVVVLVTAGFLLFSGGGSSQASPSPSVSPSPTPSASPSPQGKPGTQTGTVDPQPAPTAVACGAQAPKAPGKPKPQFAGPPPMKIDTSKTYVATMETSCGTIVDRARCEDRAADREQLRVPGEPPFLRRPVLHPHRYLDRRAAGRRSHRHRKRRSGYSIPDELRGGEQYAPGAFAMANAGANTGGSQFFIITGPNGHKLDGEPELHDLRQHHRRPQGRAVDPAAPDQGPHRAASQGDITGQAPKQAVYIDSVTITEKP